MARSESEYGSEGEGDWEGADDIYDQYRYSRFSMASKMSRFSKGSIYTIGSGSDAPPMPNQRTSLESTSSGRERKESKGKLPSRLAESTTLADVGEEANFEEIGNVLAERRGTAADHHQPAAEDVVDLMR